jgi:hypothetical protein
MAEARVRGRNSLKRIALLALVAACGGTTEPTTMNFTAVLAGSYEVPPRDTRAQGVASLTISGDRLLYHITASGFAAPLILGSIHVGSPATAAGPIIVPFTIIAQSGTVASGEVDLTNPVSYNTLTISGDSLRSLLNAGLTYVNLFTPAYPGGEIRGQVARQ